MGWGLRGEDEEREMWGRRWRGFVATTTAAVVDTAVITTAIVNAKISTYIHRMYREPPTHSNCTHVKASTRIIQPPQNVAPAPRKFSHSPFFCLFFADMVSCLGVACAYACMCTTCMYVCM